MELASQDLIATLLRDAGGSTPARSPRGGVRMDGSQPHERAAARWKPRCHCGQCRQCLDEARWERIYTEKFADPEYYTRRHVRCVSPLESL